MKLILALACSFLLSCPSGRIASGEILSDEALAKPQLRTQGTTQQLVVDGKPFLILGGELGNSAATTLESMEPIWPRLVKLNLNTVLVPVYWDLLQPREGEFDFALVDGAIEKAREHNLKIIFLWFGSWKNSMSCYAPGWVKGDQEQFPRTEGSDGKGLEILSPFIENNYVTDAWAFRHLMQHLREVDGQQHTVIMVQVENEIGMIPEARDHSAIADELYQQQVPEEFMDYLVAHKKELVPEFRAVWQAAGGKETGTWEEVFGPGVGTEEIFMAWHFAKYTEWVTAAGKAEYPLPMFVNAALMRPNYKPGQYPSGGPLPHLMDVWRAGAPSIDLLTPDIYFPNFVEWCRKYDRGDNPLFIPETYRGSEAAAYVFYAIGEHDALGVSPFAIDHLTDPENQPLAASYDLLRQLTPVIQSYQGRGRMAGVAPDVSFDEKRVPTEQQVRLNEYTFNVTFERPAEPTNVPGLAPGKSLSGGLILAEGLNEYLIAGTGIIVTFTTDTPGDPLVGIESVEQGRFEGGQWKVERWLGGDETHQGRHVRIPPGEFDIQRVKLYRYR